MVSEEPQTHEKYTGTRLKVYGQLLQSERPRHAKVRLNTVTT